MSDNQQKAWDNYPAALPRDTILAGRYIIQDVLGQGGFGITYLAEDYQSKGNVAIKEFFPESMAMRQSSGLDIRTYTDERSENFRFGMQGFIEEAKLLAQLRGNPHIVTVHGYFEENSTAYFVMDYIKGTDFKTYIREHGGKIGWDETWKIMQPVMKALHAAHQKGIIHRDVAPDNIIIMEDGTVKLIDFGAARYSLGERSQSLDVVLKPGYTPKEQYLRRGKQGPYTDVYSVAACFYAALSGYLPPESLERMEEDTIVPLSVRGVQLPTVAERAIMQGLKVRAEERFQSMEAFESAIAWIDQISDPIPPILPIPPTPPIPPIPDPPEPEPPIPAPPSPKSKKKLFAVAAVCAVIIGCAAGTGVFFMTGGRNSDNAEGIVADDIQDTAAERDVSNKDKQLEMLEDTTESAESVIDMPEPVWIEDDYYKPESLQSDMGDGGYYMKGLDALLDVYCRDDAAAYVALGIGTEEEAHQLHEDLLDAMLIDFLSEDLYDQYGESYREYLKSALAKADYMTTDVEQRGEGYLITVQYRQLKYFEAVETEYKAWIRALMEGWMDDPETVPDNGEDVTDNVLEMLYFAMEDALYSVQYGKKVSAVVDLDADDEDGLGSLLIEGLFDLDKMEVFAEQYENGFMIRGYDVMHYYFVWDKGDVYLGEWNNDGMPIKGVYVWSDGEIYAGSIKDGKRNGYGVNIDADGSKNDGNWKDDEMID